MMITGGCGFIGSNFIRYMLKESDEIEQKDKKWL
jgi:dTDP-D-glucose 4,6-dehydratase